MLAAADVADKRPGPPGASGDHSDLPGSDGGHINDEGDRLGMLLNPTNASPPHRDDPTGISAGSDDDGGARFVKSAWHSSRPSLRGLSAA